MTSEADSVCRFRGHFLYDKRKVVKDGEEKRNLLYICLNVTYQAIETTSSIYECDQ